MRKHTYNTLLIVLFTMVSCMAQRTDSKEGILAGTIGLYEGNCMPGPGVTPCEPKPIAATILITQLAESFDEALLVKQLRSNEEGVYSTSLPPGQYSLFLKDGDEIVCTLIQCPDKCICHPFEIKSDSTTIVDANLDHATW